MPTSIQHDLGISYGELLGLAARELGDETLDATTGELIPPTSADSLARARRVVNDAVRRLVSETPDWGWLRQRYTISIVADQQTYQMPWWFNGIEYSDWAYTGSNAPLLRIKTVTESDMMALLQDDVETSGDPYFCAFRRKPVQSGTSTWTGWEAVMYPTPSASRTVEFTARAFPERMHQNDHRFIAGPEYDRFLKTAVQLEASLELRNEFITQRKAEYAEARQQAMKINSASRPRYAGQLSKTMDDPLAAVSLPAHTDESSIVAYGTTIL